jgi:flagellar protein FlgJ
MNPSQSTANVYTDFNGLAELRRQAQTDQSSALRQVAEQFEALFMQMMMKSMRDAKLADGGLFDSPQSEQYRDMLDSQLSVSLSEGRGMGLADVIVRQLGGGESLRPTSEVRGRTLPSTSPPARLMGATAGTPENGAESVPETGLSESAGAEGEADYTASPREFVRTILPYAREAAGVLGLGPEVLIAQSALETGWGRGVIRDHLGESSHNLFNIKADARWDGPVVTKRTLEYIDGVAVQQRADFRRYDSPVESFKDYVSFLNSSPRYREALEHRGDAHRFVEGLQAAGYATDPDYAVKIKEILDRSVVSGQSLPVKSSTAAPIATPGVSL